MDVDVLPANAIDWAPNMIATVYAMRDEGARVVDICDRLGICDGTLRRARREGIINWPFVPRPHSAPRKTHCVNGHDLSIHGKMVRHNNFSGGASRRCGVCHAANTAASKERRRQLKEGEKDMVKPGIKNINFRPADLDIECLMDISRLTGIKMTSDVIRLALREYAVVVRARLATSSEG